MQRLLSEEPSIVYIANPGNPTGTHLDPSELEAFLAAVPAHIVVVLDEAYFEYMPEAGRGDAIGWVRRHSNLLVTRTFSKAYGLAGLRVGFGIAQKTLADMLRRTRPPFTVSAAAQVGATAALLDDEFLARTMAENRASLKELCSGLDQMELRYLPSSTNFVLAQVGDGAAWTRALERHALIVRPVVAYGLPDWLRLSIGTAAEVKRLVRAMRSESDLLATSKARAA
jgi:histidinol-phosphate aminotransferase